MSQIFKNSGLHDPNSSRWKKVARAPLRLLVKGYWLADDCVHWAVNRPAEWVERKTGINRFTTCCATLAAGVGADVLITGYGTGDWKYASAHLISDAFIYIPFSTLAIWIATRDRLAIADGQLYEDVIRPFRFPVLLLSPALGVIDYLSQDYRISGGIATIASTSVMCYLLSSSNGTIDGLKDFAREARVRFTAWRASHRKQTPVPGVPEPVGVPQPLPEPAPG